MIVNYLVFNKNETEENSDLYESKFFNWTRDLIFTNVQNFSDPESPTMNFEINSMSIENK